MNFSDFNALIPIIGKSAEFLGNIAEKDKMKIKNSYLLAFFDSKVKGKNNSSLLETGASKIFNEVTVEIY